MSQFICSSWVGTRCLTQGGTYSFVELGASFLAIFLEFLFGIGRVAGELALDLCGYSVGVAYER